MKPKHELVESVAPTLSSEEQLRELRKYLATSEPFRICRGKLGGTDWFFGDVLDDKTLIVPGQTFASPTAVEAEFNRRHGQARVLLTHLAKLRRDGHMVAYNELLAALSSDRFVITGEEWPLDKRKIGTLVMFEPERTIKLMRWLKLLHPKIIERHLGYSTSSGEQVFEKFGLIDRPELRWLTDEILSEWPTIREGFKKYGLNNTDGHWIEFRKYLPKSLLPEEFNSLEWFREDGKWSELSFDDYLCAWLRPVSPSSDSGEIGEHLQNWSCAAFFPGKKQDEVLSMFQRDKRDRIATWQLSFPAHVSSVQANDYPCSFGLFPERELGRFKGLWPAYTSGSKQGGMGAVVIDSRRSVPMTDPLFQVEVCRQAEDAPDVQDVGFELFLPGLY